MLSENTKVTVGLVIALVGGMVFITKAYILSDSNAQDISDLQSHQMTIIQDLAEIKADTRFMKQLMTEEREK